MYNLKQREFHIYVSSNSVNRQNQISRILHITYRRYDSLFNELFSEQVKIF